MNTSIISFLMLIAFSAGEKGLKAGRLKGSGLLRSRIPSRLQSNNITFRSYILNGTPADIRDYPFKLSLRLFGELACSASVIAPRWALTAAHCLEMNLPPELITLYGGSSNRITGGVEFAVEEYILHPDYNLTTLDCDVGVIKIKNSFVGHRNIWPSVLANEACNTTTGMTVCLAGWGMNEDFEFPEELHEIQQTILDQDECYNLWGGDITNRMLCGAVENGVDSCIGDSGTKAIILMHVMNFSIPCKILQRVKRRWEQEKSGAVLVGFLQVGIISFGSGVCGEPIPNVFTRIEHPIVRQFIRRLTGV